MTSFDLKTPMQKIVSMASGALLALACVALPAKADVTVTFLHADSTGSPVLATDANGAVLWRESFKPYGARTVNDAAASTQKVYFAGHAAVGTSQLIDMGERVYDPLLGSFLGMDPVEAVAGDSATFSRYSYARNSPYAFTDPDGRVATPIDVVFLAIDIGTFVTAPSVGGAIDIATALIPGYPAGTIRAARLAMRAAHSAEIGWKPLKLELKSRKYDRPALRTRSERAMASRNAVDDWDAFLGPNQTNIDPRDGFPDPDRLWSADGKRSIRYGEHEMEGARTKGHYHKETWHEDHVVNEMQRMQVPRPPSR